MTKITLMDLLNEEIPKWIYYLGGAFMYALGYGVGSSSILKGVMLFFFTLSVLLIFTIIELIYKNRGKSNDY